MYNLYIPLCGLILNVILFILYKCKVENVREENRFYLLMLIDVFLMSVFSIITIHLICFDYNQNVIELANKIEYFVIFNYFINLMMYVLSIGKLYSKKEMMIYDIFNLVMILVIFMLPITVEVTNKLSIIITGLSVTITILSSLIVLLLTLVILFKNKLKLNDKIIPIVTLIIFMAASLIIKILIPEFMGLEFLLIVALLIMYDTLENPYLKKVKELNVAKEEADKSNNAKTDFLSSMSHEIRTPLNAIVGFNQCIAEAETLEEAKENSQYVVTAANTLIEIINGILDISKIESGKLELVNVKYKPKVLFDEVIKLLEPRLIGKGLELKVKISDDLPYRLRGDQFNLKKCIINILTNAVKYTDEGSVTLGVDCVIQDNICELIISVEDTGRGIKNEDLEKIFSKFQRLEEYRNSAIEGTGLGLAITKQIIELMGGKVVIQSVYKKGSKFTIVVSQEIVNMYQSTESMNRVVTPENNLLKFKDKKVLIVDDNNLNLKVASKLLSKYELTIDTAMSGFEAIEKIKDEKYDLILMDDMMPKMSGKETLHKLKENKDFNIPVIALTANAFVGEREKYIKEGFTEYLSKPINREELEKVLKHFLGNNRKKPINFDDTQTMVLDFSKLKN